MITQANPATEVLSPRVTAREAGDIVGGQYEITPLDPEDPENSILIASTPRSNLYHGVNVDSGAEVAIKLPLTKSAQQRLVGETSMHAMFSDHPNVVTVDGFGESRGLPFLATEYQRKGGFNTLVNSMSSDSTHSIDQVLEEVEDEVNQVQASEFGELGVDFVAMTDQLRFDKEVAEELETVASGEEAVEVIVEKAQEHGFDVDPEDLLPKVVAVDLLKTVQGNIRKESAFTAEETRDRLVILSGALGAYATMHAADRLFIDIKSHNVLIGSGDGALVTDFGMMLRGVASHPRYVGGMRVAKGSANYIAPETVYGEFSAKSDVFSASVLAYKALAGVLPYGFAGNNEENLVKITTEELIVPSLANKYVSTELSDAISTGLSGDPAKRAVSMAQLAQSVRNSLQTLELSR